ncbi:MAG: hypothetical protein KJ795_09970 [Gammaproteobacteria bacterium]|nr:hypothetical protein [Gammaproteobacteria bacterium]MBU1776390.1 hypothetical protein [Gammaproteobacteria bacterium]MBU1968097.1 hypothetical protein [Gammaproteobacteria bacterium]
MSDSIPYRGPLINNPNDGLTTAELGNMKRQLAEKLQALAALGSGDPLQHARLQLDIAELLNALERKKEAWDIAREAFVTAMRHESWADAVEACDVLFQSQQADAMAALGMGIWLAVTFPVDPELTAAMLIHLVEETPDASDTGALAAITTRYVIDLRASDDAHENLSFLADNLISMVAKRHSNVQDQAAMDRWLERLQLREPQVFLPRLSQEVETIVAGKWWFERDELRRRLPD